MTVVGSEKKQGLQRVLHALYYLSRFAALDDLLIKVNDPILFA